ncbi:hypothetical protein [Nocardioides sp. Leaf285]|uniref:hypothetical protein n=1 Tax=Nocardioides sp. Leaf285 TaxID=1736322 RepID=UPI000702562E|nr:hypothetical protein [Nocardioides sp. Leaf285]KQP62936.1 hypothetical protein ASF47_18155 [Nocardioides sp. Leaf285]
MTTETSAADRTARRPIFASHVSRLLARAGLTRFVSETTSVRGYHRYCPGYRVIGSTASFEEGFLDVEDGGRVTVHHETLGTSAHDPLDPARDVESRLGAYASVLEDNGLHVEQAVSQRRAGRPGRPYLVVSGPRLDEPTGGLQ